MNNHISAYICIIFILIGAVVGWASISGYGGVLILYSIFSIGFLTFRSRAYKPDTKMKKNILNFILITNTVSWLIKLTLS